MSRDFSDDTVSLMITWVFLSNTVNTDVDRIFEYDGKGTVTHCNMVTACIPMI